MHKNKLIFYIRRSSSAFFGWVGSVMVEVVAVSGIYNRTLTHTKEMKYLAFSRHRYFVVIQMAAVRNRPHHRNPHKTLLIHFIHLLLILSLTLPLFKAHRDHVWLIKQFFLNLIFSHLVQQCPLAIHLAIQVFQQQVKLRLTMTSRAAVRKRTSG